MAVQWFDWCGYVGVLLILLAFLFLQVQWLNGNRWIYQLMNVLGALGIIISLVFGRMNLPSLVLEIAWFLIGIYGMIIAHHRRERMAEQTNRPGPTSNY